MKRVVGLLVAVALCLPAGASAWWKSIQQVGVGAPAAYVGPGDVQSGAALYGGLRAYNAAYAAATGNLADLVASTGGASVCTLKAAANGSADLSGSYCAGTTVPLACAAASGGICSVSKLYDQTGGGNPFVQATLANMPALIFNDIGGTKPGLRFNGSQFLTSTLSNAASQPMTCSFVAERTGNFTNFNAAVGSPFMQCGFSSSANTVLVYNGTVGTITYSGGEPGTSVFHAVQGVLNDPSSVAYVDGVSTSTTVGTSSTAAISFGGAGSGNDQLTGDVAEAGYWTIAFSSGIQASMNSNQHSYWGF